MSHTTSEGAELSQLTLLEQAECRRLSRGAALSWAELRTPLAQQKNCCGSLSSDHGRDPIIRL
jgi:hypothetical protein